MILGYYDFDFIHNQKMIIPIYYESNFEAFFGTDKVVDEVQIFNKIGLVETANKLLNEMHVNYNHAIENYIKDSIAWLNYNQRLVKYENYINKLKPRSSISDAVGWIFAFGFLGSIITWDDKDTRNAIIGISLGSLLVGLINGATLPKKVEKPEVMQKPIKPILTIKQKYSNDQLKSFINTYNNNLLLQIRNE